MVYKYDSYEDIKSGKTDKERWERLEYYWNMVREHGKLTKYEILRLAPKERTVYKEAIRRWEERPLTPEEKKRKEEAENGAAVVYGTYFIGIIICVIITLVLGDAAGDIGLEWWLFSVVLLSVLILYIKGKIKEIKGQDGMKPDYHYNKYWKERI